MAHIEHNGKKYPIPDGCTAEETLESLKAAGLGGAEQCDAGKERRQLHREGKAEGKGLMTAAIVEKMRSVVVCGNLTTDRPGYGGSCVVLPRTMRQLIEGRWDDTHEKETAPDMSVLFGFEAFMQLPGAMDRSGVPIRPDQLIEWKPAVQGAGCEDLRNWAPICQAFFGWLKTQHQEKTVNIDHPLSDRSWPLVDRLEGELNLRNCSLDKLFGFWDWQFEPQEVDTHQVYIPVWDMQRDDESVPVVEFLHGVQTVIKKSGYDDLQWPEAVYESGVPHGQVSLALAALVTICRQKRWRLLPPPWKTALQALVVYPHWPIGCWELGYYWWVEPTETTADMVHLFDILDKVKAMFIGIWPLMKAVSNNASFWESLIMPLVKAVKRHPELVKQPKPEKINQPLIEVLAHGEEKIKIKI
jgi:hypothetical protein